jgi:predicted secreted hydrolase
MSDYRTEWWYLKGKSGSIGLLQDSDRCYFSVTLTGGLNGIIFDGIS